MQHIMLDYRWSRYFTTSLWPGTRPSSEAGRVWGNDYLGESISNPTPLPNSLESKVQRLSSKRHVLLSLFRSSFEYVGSKLHHRRQTIDCQNSLSEQSNVRIHCHSLNHRRHLNFRLVTIHCQNIQGSQTHLHPHRKSWGARVHSGFTRLSALVHCFCRDAIHMPWVHGQTDDLCTIRWAYGVSIISWRRYVQCKRIAIAPLGD